jgi:predicted membrane chloride channel (bestrophin family)
MPQRQLDQLTDLSHLLAAAADIIVADLVKVSFLILALYGLTLAVDYGILGNDAELRWVYLNDLELDLAHTTAGCERIALTHGPVSFPEVGSQENIE